MCGKVPEKAGECTDYSPCKFCHEDDCLDYVLEALVDEDADQFEYYADDDGQDEEADCPGLYRVFVYAAVYEAVE